MMPGLWSKGRATLKTVERNLYTSFLNHLSARTLLYTGVLSLYNWWKQSVNTRDLSRTWEMTSKLRQVLGSIYVHPIVSWGTCKAQGVGLLVIKQTRAGETRQGRLRWFDEAIAWSLDGNLNCHFFRGFYGGQASHDILHMRRRYSVLSGQS